MKTEFIDITILIFGFLLLAMFLAASSRRIYWEASVFLSGMFRWIKRLWLRRVVSRIANDMTKTDLDRLALAIIMTGYREDSSPTRDPAMRIDAGGLEPTVRNMLNESLSHGSRDFVIDSIRTKIMENDPVSIRKALLSVVRTSKEI